MHVLYPHLKTQEEMNSSIANEPNYQTACQWWSDLPNIWTPIGWKNHLFRFNVLWNGVLVAKPDLNRRTGQWQDQGIQVAVWPTTTEEVHRVVARNQTMFLHRDDGMVTQGWEPSATPVLWSDLPKGGFLMRQRVFAHIPGAEDIETGIEPLFAWIRLSLHHVCDALSFDGTFDCLIKVNRPHIKQTSMNLRGNILFDPDNSKYPRKLTCKRHAYDAKRGLLVMEEDGKVRLGLAPGQKHCRAVFGCGKPTANDCYIQVRLKAVKGAHVDLLVPMLATDKRTFDRELSLGYDKALEQAEQYWSRTPSTRATISTPEHRINETISQGLKFAEVIAERNPATGAYSMISGSYTYSNLWATPHSTASIMLLDTMGYHTIVERYLEIFRKEQGTVVPPGDSFELHPGYLSSPKSLTSVDWLTDHGAILYTIAEHALVSGSRTFVARWVGSIVKACEFIQYARSIRKHGGIEGIMPAAVSTDMGVRTQAVWSDGWAFKGLTAAVRLLKRIEHSRAQEFSEEAVAYREAFGKALRSKVKAMPKWKDKRKRTHHLVPSELHDGVPLEMRHPFYLDTGPLFLVYSGLLDANDELMKSALLWFRDGPQRQVHRCNSNGDQVACLHHEMSSYEPGYSWNVFHSHQLGDRKRFLEGMYSLFTGAISRKTFISCESRGGITGNIFSVPLATYLARLSVIDDQLNDDELHVLRLIPLAWLVPGRESRFLKMPTEFGPVSVKVKLSKDRGRLDVDLKTKYRLPPRRTVLHVPPLVGLKTVTANGRRLKWSARNRQVLLADI